jgi:hypothetical protein
MKLKILFFNVRIFGVLGELGGEKYFFINLAKGRTF